MIFFGTLYVKRIFVKNLKYIIMRKLLFALPLVAIVFFSSCKETEEVDPNIAGEVTGTYKMNKYIFHNDKSDTDLSGSSLSVNLIKVTHIDDTHVRVVVDYLAPTTTDQVYDNVIVSESGESYKLKQSYDNATMTGSVSGDDISVDIDYTDGDYVYVDGERR